MLSVKYIRNKARQILKDFDVQQPPVPIREMIEGFALTIEEVSGPKGYDGELIPERRRIRINSRRPKTRQRFTLAHELGHWVLYHKERLFSYDDDDASSSAVIKDAGYDEIDPFDDEEVLLDPDAEDFVPEPVDLGPSKLKRDREADTFAAELLMPTSWVREHWKQLGPDVEALAQLYRVSREAMWIKVRALGLLNR